MQNPYKVKLAALTVSFVTVTGVNACNAVKEDPPPVKVVNKEEPVPQIAVNPPPPPPMPPPPEVSVNPAPPPLPVKN